MTDEPSPPRRSEALHGFHESRRDDDPEALYDRAPCGYLSTTPDGVILKFNQTFQTMAGYDHPDHVPRRFVDLLTPGGRIYHETHYAPMIRMHGKAQEIAFDLLGADGDRRPVLVNSVLEERDGRPAVIRIALFEAAHRREYERELLRAKQRAEDSEERATALARALQQTFVPPPPSEVPGLAVATAYRPAGSGDEVGGDFFDVFPVSSDHWIIAIGDVCGKGVEAAVVTALARHTIRARAVTHDKPSDILAALNVVLLAEPTDRYCTVALASLKCSEGCWRATICCAGHPPPIHERPGEGTMPPLANGTLLGPFEDPHLSDTTVSLQSGDRLVFYTDGVTEGRSDDALFGEDRLRSIVRCHEGDAALLAEAVLSDVVAFQGGMTRDDIALVVAVVPDNVRGSAR